MDSTVINVLINTAQSVQAGGERLALVIPPSNGAWRESRR